MKNMLGEVGLEIVFEGIRHGFKSCRVLGRFCCPFGIKRSHEPGDSDCDSGQCLLGHSPKLVLWVHLSGEEVTDGL